MIEGTMDPKIYIVDRTADSITYWDVYGGQRWRIDGHCSMCGACWQGAVYDVQALDCPVRPEISENPGCTLTGVYL